MHERAVRPLGLVILEQREQTPAFDLLLHLSGQCRAGDLGERGEEIEVCAERIALHAGGDAAGGPAEERRRA